MTIPKMADILEPAGIQGDAIQSAADDLEMRQVRDLLFGDTQKITAQRLGALEGRLTILEGAVKERLDKIEQMIVMLGTTTESSHREKILELGKAIAELSDKVMQSAESTVAVVQTHDDTNQ